MVAHYRYIDSAVDGEKYGVGTRYNGWDGVKGTNTANAIDKPAPPSSLARTVNVVVVDNATDPPTNTTTQEAPEHQGGAQFVLSTLTVGSSSSSFSSSRLWAQPVGSFLHG